MQIFLLLTSSAAAAACLLTFVARQKRGRSLSYYFAMGIALQFLFSLPAGVYQGLVGLQRAKPKPLPARLAMAGIGAPYNMGGWTVHQAFEEITDPRPSDPTGATPPAALVQYPVYLILLLLQVGLVAYIFARRIRSRQDFTDPWLFALGMAVLINSLANAGWVWWGR